MKEMFKSPNINYTEANARYAIHPVHNEHVSPQLWICNSLKHTMSFERTLHLSYECIDGIYEVILWYDNLLKMSNNIHSFEMEFVFNSLTVERQRVWFIIIIINNIIEVLIEHGMDSLTIIITLHSILPNMKEERYFGLAWISISQWTLTHQHFI